MSIARIISFPFYPLVIAALPILHFYRVNWGSTDLSDVVRWILVYWVVTALLLCAARWVWRDWGKAGLMAGVLAYVLFYSGAIAGWGAALVVGLAVVLGAALQRLRAGLAGPTTILNAGFAVFFAFPILRTARAQIILTAPTPRPGYSDALPLRVPPATLPDIYYILSDGLGQPEVLERLYGLQPRELLERFDALGFWVAPGSRSNYPQTALSVAATLNMDFVQNLLDIANPTSADRRPLRTLVAHNRVVNTLRRLGYRVITYPAGYSLTHLADAEIRRQPRLRLGFLEFHVLRNSVLPHLERLLGRGPADLSFSIHRHRLRHIFRELPHARHGVAEANPVFVFAHLLAPHPPFVFGRDGEAMRSEQRFSFRDGDHWRLEQPKGGTPYRQLYRNQALYIVNRLADTVAEIIRTSTRPVVIIVQGDHGPGSQLTWDVVRSTNMVERHGIFNAWYLPEEVTEGPYPGITSVNTFRVVFNALFDAGLPLLDDRAWYARWISPYSFSELHRARSGGSR